MQPQIRFAVPPSTMQSAGKGQSEGGPARLTALPFTRFFNEVLVIDPKQGPLFRTRHKAEMSASSRPHPAKHTSAETAPEPKSAGKRPFASKRQFSVVGS